MPDAYTMQPVADDQTGMGDLTPFPQDDQDQAPQQMDPGSMAQLFDGGGEEQGEMPPDAEQGEAPPGGDQVDPQKLQSVLSDPDLLMAVAQTLKTLGTGQDTDLVHVTEQEKQMLKEGGGAGTPNPTTGLLQYTMPPRPGEVAGQPYGVPDWYGMHPDERLAHVAKHYVPPGWAPNWWDRSDARQGGVENNFTGRDLVDANVAVHPSWGTALSMAGLVGTLATGGPIGLIAKMGIGQLAETLFGKDSLPGMSFDTPGGTLPADAQQRVLDAYNNAPKGMKQLALNKQLGIERGALGAGPGGQEGGPGPGMSAGIGVDKDGNAYGTNIGGAGVSHNLAGGGPATAMDAKTEAARQAYAQAQADRARAFAAGGYGRAGMGGYSGGGDGGGDVGGGGPSGGDRGGGMGGGVGHDHGSNRSV